MYERFTDAARQTFQLANQTAQSWNHEYIGVEHILAGLIKLKLKIPMAYVFDRLGVDGDALLREIELLVQHGPEMVTHGKLPQTPRSRKVVEHAMEVARDRHQSYVGVEHVLLGLLKDPESVACVVLNRAGLTYENVFARLDQPLPMPSSLESLSAGSNFAALVAAVERALDMPFGKDVPTNSWGHPQLIPAFQVLKTPEDVANAIKQSAPVANTGPGPLQAQLDLLEVLRTNGNWSREVMVNTLRQVVTQLSEHQLMLERLNKTLQVMREEHASH